MAQEIYIIMHNLLSSVWLIPLVPLLAAAWIALGYIFKMNRGEAGEAQTSQTALTASALSLLLILALDVFALLYGTPGQIKYGPWLESGDYQVFISFTLDALGLVMTTLMALISLLTIKFSVNYLHREAGYQRFFISLCVFNSAMILITLAGNAVLTLVGWKLAAVSSYLLIAYAPDRATATANANQAFITNRIGDGGFILAISLSFIWLGSVEWPDILLHKTDLSSLHIGLIAGGFLLAALVKSALFPFSTWITKALEGPTPSSAIFYGSLMVHAGIYLIIRLQPLFIMDGVLLPLLVLIGLITFAYGFLSGLVQTDVKSALIFSVISQVGIMLTLCGLGLFDWAAVYLVLHAVWRAYQFLHAPSYMQLMSRPTRPVSLLIGQWRWLYTASLQRFWLDKLTNWMLVNPVRKLAREARSFDEKVVNKVVGLPGQASTLSSLDQLESESTIGKGRGIAGSLMEWLANKLGWFEEHLVLHGGGKGMSKVIHHLGGYVLKIEVLLSQPRYLVILIIATFMVIL